MSGGGWVAVKVLRLRDDPEMLKVGITSKSRRLSRSACAMLSTV